MRDDDPVPNISKMTPNYVAELARLVSIVNRKNKNKMPPPAPTFWKKVDENQVCYFIWPNFELLKVVSLNKLGQWLLELRNCSY